MSSSKGKRNFTVAGSSVNVEGGHYKITAKGTPAGAARKAAKSIFRIIENKDNNPEWHKYEHFKDQKIIKFILRETTKDSSKKSYYYEAKLQHIKKEDQKPVMINGVEIIHTKKIVVKSCNDKLIGVGSTAK